MTDTRFKTIFTDGEFIRVMSDELVTASYVARTVGCTLPTAKAALAKLETQGYVEKVPVDGGRNYLWRNKVDNHIDTIPKLLTQMRSVFDDLKHNSEVASSDKADFNRDLIVVDRVCFSLNMENLEYLISEIEKLSTEVKDEKQE